MPRSVAFLRGINVGGHRVTMDEVRDAFSACGLSDVTTFLASGNVAFSTDREDAEVLRCEVEALLEERLGYAVPTLLRSVTEVEALAAFDHGVEARGAPTLAHYVVLLDAAPTTALRESLAALESDTDVFAFTDREVHWVVRGKMSESPLFGREMDRVLRTVRYTTRNVNTLRRLAKREGQRD